MKERNALFAVVEEENCPLYIVGDEFRVKDLALTVSRGKPACLALTPALVAALDADGPASPGARLPGGATGSPYGRSGRFMCGGCDGRIRFAPKKTTAAFATSQMQMMAAAKRQADLCRADRGFAVLRGLPAFAELDDDELQAFCGLGHMRRYDPDEIVVSRGQPMRRLFIVLSGRVRRSEQGQDGRELGQGGLFGELSLVADTVHSGDYRCLEPTEILEIPAALFKAFIGKQPGLHLFFAQQIARRVENRMDDSSGLNASLKEVVVVDLCQLIHTSRMTGRVQLTLGDGATGRLLFNEGELVAAQHGSLSGKQAFFSLIARHDGAFKFTTGLTPEEAGLPMLGSFMGLLMEGIQRMDESVAG